MQQVCLPTWQPPAKGDVSYRVLLYSVPANPLCWDLPLGDKGLDTEWELGRSRLILFSSFLGGNDNLGHVSRV